MISAKGAEKKSATTLSAIVDSFVGEEKTRIQNVLNRGSEAQDSGTSSSSETFEELKILRKFFDKINDHYSLSLCECCQKVYIMGESIRGIHGDQLQDGKFSQGKAVHYGKKEILKYLDELIEMEGRTRPAGNLSHSHRPIKVELPRIGVVKSTGKFESFPQSVVLWCRAVPIADAEERVASIVREKPFWLSTMVSRLRLQEKSTVDDVNRYLDTENPRFLLVQSRPSAREIEFWIRVAGPSAKFGPPVRSDLKKDLNAMVDLLGKRLKTTGRRSTARNKAKTNPKASSGSDNSSDTAEPTPQKKNTPTFQSTLSAISKKNGGRPDKTVIEEKDPEKKIKMVLRKLGGTDSTIPSDDWTCGINASLLGEQLEAAKLFTSCFGVTLPRAIQILNDATASQSSRKRKVTNPKDGYLGPRFPPEPAPP